MGVDFRSIFEPGDVRPGVAPGDTQECNFMSQHVFIIEVGVQNDFGPLKMLHWFLVKSSDCSYVVVVVILIRFRIAILSGDRQADLELKRNSATQFEALSSGILFYLGLGSSSTSSPSSANGLV